MGLISGIFGSKTKTNNDPWKAAQPYLIKGMDQTNQVFDQNQPRLADMSKQAYDGFNNVAPGAFGDNPFVKNAQGAAGFVGSGGLLGSNSGQATYNRLQNPGGSGGGIFGGMRQAQPVGGGQGGDPSMGLLSRMATDQRPGAGDGALRGMSGGPDAYTSGVTGGQFLNNQPSASVYDSMMNPDYLQGNPYLEDQIARTNAGVTKNANRMFAQRGMGTGLSSAFGDILTKNLAGNESQLRYQNYNDASARQLQAAGQSDAAWQGERGRMDNLYGAGQDRALSAAQALNQSGQAGMSSRLAAAQGLGSQFNAGQDRSLEAAKAGDTMQNNQVQQMLQALGLTGELRNAEYAGISPALSLLNTAADIPYVGVGALNGNIRQASNGYGSSTTRETPSLMQAAGQTMQMAAMASDIRLKKNIEKVGELEDGLSVIDYDYIDEKYGKGRFRGVAAHEVAEKRPWALGPKIDGEYSTVHYGAL